MPENIVTTTCLQRLSFKGATSGMPLTTDQKWLSYCKYRWIKELQSIKRVRIKFYEWLGENVSNWTTTRCNNTC